METRIKPSEAMDYPTLPGDLVVIWVGNEYRWPDGRRRLSYLSETKTDPVKGYALFTDNSGDAKVFSTREEAAAWLTKQTELRSHPYTGAKIGTVYELTADRFPA